MLMPDHVHLFVRCKPSQAIVRQFKGYSSYRIRQAYPKYRMKYKHFWAPGYYVETIGHISEETIKKYIDNQ
jgi:putative transposase